MLIRVLSRPAQHMKCNEHFITLKYIKRDCNELSSYFCHTDILERIYEYIIIAQNNENLLRLGISIPKALEIHTLASWLLTSARSEVRVAFWLKAVERAASLLFS